MHKPLLSVIVPVYRAEAYLDDCVSSILAQTYGDLELILIEDGSPDGCAALCDGWAEKDPRVQVIHQENQGGGAARNAGLDAARGELIAFVDSDDYIAPEMFTHLYELLQQGADIAECGYMEVTGEQAIFPPDAGQVCVCTGQEAMAEHIADRYFRQLIWNKLYRREMVAGIRFPAGTKIDDEFFTYQVLGRAKKLARSERICYAYRQQSASVMHQKFSLSRTEGLLAKEQRLEYVKQNFPTLENQAREELILSCVYVMQGSLKALKGPELAKARQIVTDRLEAAKPCRSGKDASRMRRWLLKLAQRDVVLAAKILNFLTDIRVLT